MIPSSLVQADVIDVRDGRKDVPATFLIDANVLYFAFYQEFQDLGLAGGQLPLPYQLAAYLAWLRRTEQASSLARVLPLSIGEFMKASEYAALEANWLSHPNRFQFDPANPEMRFSPRLAKACRYSYPNDLARIRRRVRDMIDSLLKAVNLLPAPSAAADLQATLDEWQASAGDPPDAALVAATKHAGVSALVSDDIDLITFAGVTVYTANGRAVDSARAAGRLL